ncbi:MAG: penicillin-binding protein 1C, partial [Duodenibacillus sp.]|nr:penicillin-binding protein 1C [Duodenibacillus sp.]
PRRRLLSPEAAYVTLSMLETPGYDVMTRGRRSPARWKTGTSNGFRDAWTAGVIGDYVLVVWAGNFDNRANPLLIGAEAALPLFMDIARALASRLDMRDALPAREAGLNVERVEACAATGDLETRLCPGETAQTLFIPGVSPIRPTGILREVMIDKATGLRACRFEPGRTETRPVAFWPSDMRRMFALAGVEKPEPPAWLPGCRDSGDAAAGTPPLIRSPKAGVTYHVRASAPEKSRVALLASAGAGARRVFWFAGDEFIGESAPEAPLLWTPKPGRTMLKAVDDLGRASRQPLTVKAAR